MLFRAHFPVIEIIVVLQAFSLICWKLEMHGFLALILAEMKTLLVEKYPSLLRRCCRALFMN